MVVKRVHVQLFGKALPKKVQIDADATEGAVVDKDLRWFDGSVVKESEIRNTAVTVVTETGQVIQDVALTIWSLILQIPAFIKNIGNLTGTGLIARISAGGDAAVRTIQGTPNEIIVTNGDGVAGDPVISIDPLFGGVGGDWPIIKDYIGALETFTVPLNFQMLVWKSFDIIGSLTVDGKLIILGDHDTDFVKEYVAPVESIIIPTRHQMLVAEAYDVEGTLDAEGILAIL